MFCNKVLLNKPIILETTSWVAKKYTLLSLLPEPPSYCSKTRMSFDNNNINNNIDNNNNNNMTSTVSNTLRNGINIVYKGLITQKETAIELLRDSRFRAPLISIYVATAGGALHDPVTTFFYLELGTSTTQLGEIQALAFISAFLLAPIYGHVLDTYGSYFPLVISCFFCGLGCFIRCIAPNSTWLYISSIILGLGGGNLWTVTLSHLSVYTEDARKALVVSAFVFQVTSLRIIGKASYPLWNFFVEHVCGVSDKLLRYRIHMSTCTIMCLFGFIYTVFFDGNDLRRLKPPSASTNGSSSSSNNSNGGKIVVGSNKISDEEERFNETETLVTSTSAASTSNKPHQNAEWERKLKRLSFFILLIALFLQASSKAATNTLWPLYLKEYFDFNPTSFSYLLLSSTIFSTLGISALPILGSLYGEKKTLLWIIIVTIISSILAFQFSGKNTHHGDNTNDGTSTMQQTESTTNNISTFSLIIHAISSTVFFTAISMMEPLVKSMTTIVTPSNYQGRVFSLMSIVSGIGSIISNLIATRMYSHDTILGFKGDTFTFFCLSLTLTFGLLAVFFLPSKNHSWRS
jgi:MFS family permease